jgi:phospholipid transport system substrate-binding protein
MMKMISIFPKTNSVAALAALALAALAIAPPARAANEDPKQVVEQITGKVIEVLANDALSTETKRAKVQGIVYDWVDFETMSRLVLARNWARLSDAQKKDFVEQFRQHLSNTYGKNVDGYRNEKVKVLGTRDEARGDVTVKTTIDRGGANDIFVDYRLRKVDGRWRIIDVVIERVSLVANFRSQFQEIISQGGPDRLLTSLRQKNAAGEGADSAPAS